LPEADDGAERWSAGGYSVDRDDHMGTLDINGPITEGREPIIQSGRRTSALVRIPDSMQTSPQVRKVPISGHHHVGGSRGSTLLVRVEDVVLRLHGHMARVSAV
jgi:hypothetical protein